MLTEERVHHRFTADLPAEVAAQWRELKQRRQLELAAVGGRVVVAALAVEVVAAGLHALSEQRQAALVEVS